MKNLVLKLIVAFFCVAIASAVIFIIARERKEYRGIMNKNEVVYNKRYVNNSTLLTYALCRKLKEGPNGCDAIKDVSKDIYEKCRGYEIDYWSGLVMPSMKHSATKDDLRKISAEYCVRDIDRTDHIPKEMLGWDKKKLQATCETHTFALLSALRIVVFLKERRECNSIPDSPVVAGAFKEYCFANFDKRMDFCKKAAEKGKILDVCIQNYYLSVMALSFDDISLLPKNNGDYTTDAMLAKSLMRGNSCEDILKSTRTNNRSEPKP